MSLYGPGDEATWGACTGHPNDPRSEEQDEDDAFREALAGAINDLESALAYSQRENQIRAQELMKRAMATLGAFA